MRRSGNLRACAAEDTDNRVPQDLFESALKEEHLWTALYANIRDTWFSPRLPDLELTSTPIPVSDRMAARTNRWAIGTSTLVNGGVVATLVFWGVGRIIHPLQNSAPSHTVKLNDYALFAPSKD